MPYPIFVLEGPDNGGKSTLAKALARRCKAKTFHATYRFKGRMMQYHLATFRQALRAANTQPVILDRWWPSEVAYGNTYRSGVEPGFDLELLQELGKAYFVSYTFCMPTRFEEYWKWCSKVWVQEEEMYPKDEARYNWLWKSYRELMLQQYSYYPQNLVQHYNVSIEVPRADYGASFAEYIMARFKSQAAVLKPDQKELMKRMAHHWRLIGKVPLSELPEVVDIPVVETPKPHPQLVQGSFF